MMLDDLNGEFLFASGSIWICVQVSSVVQNYGADPVVCRVWPEIFGRCIEAIGATLASGSLRNYLHCAAG